MQFFLLITKSTSECIYCDRYGTYTIFCNSLQEPVVLTSIVILIILFCSLEIVVLHEEFPKEIIV
jgi:hypothetical protein